MVFVTCPIMCYFSVIVDESKEVQMLGVLDLSKYHTVLDTEKFLTPKGS